MPVQLRQPRALRADAVDGTVEQGPTQKRLRCGDGLAGRFLQHLHTHVMHQVAGEVTAVEATFDVVHQFVVKQREGGHEWAMGWRGGITMARFMRMNCNSWERMQCKGIWIAGKPANELAN